MTDPVKALLEACEPFEHVAEHDISDGEADADWFVVSFSCPRRLTVRDFRALSRAASVLRERGGGERSPSHLAQRARTLYDTMQGCVKGARVDDDGNFYDPPEITQFETFVYTRFHEILAELEFHQRPAPIGEDQSDLVKRIDETRAELMDMSFTRTSDGVEVLEFAPGNLSELDCLLEDCAAHISRTSGSAGREMPTHKVRICQSDEEVCPFLLGQPCACPTKEAP